MAKVTGSAASSRNETLLYSYITNNRIIRNVITEKKKWYAFNKPKYIVYGTSAFTHTHPFKKK